MKLPTCNLLVIVKLIVQVVIEFTCVLEALTEPAVMEPTKQFMVTDLVYMAQAAPLLTTNVVALNVKLRVEGGLVTENPDRENTLTPERVI